MATNERDEVTKKIELLAPAGNAECLRAAVNAGADAVYLGLGEFNARRNADNFTIDDLRESCKYAHLRGVRVYVTLNIEILPSELQNALACIARIFELIDEPPEVSDSGNSSLDNPKGEVSFNNVSFS